jgi:predicted MPP superfamily phosphohydrolase
MKKVYLLALGSLVAVFLFITVSYYFPKSVGRFPVFIVLFLADLYLYYSLRNTLKALPGWFSHFAILLYWSPAILVGLMIIGLFFYPFDNWGKGIKIYMVGFIFAAYFSRIIPMVLLAFDDTRRIIKKLFTKQTHDFPKNSIPIPRSIFLKRLGLISGGLLFSGLIAGMIKWVSDFRVRHIKIPMPALPIAFSGYKIVQISDIHLGGWASKKDLEEVVTIIGELQPDAIFFTGDLVNYKTDEAFEFIPILSRLQAKDGIFTILGNHDYGDYSHWPDEASKKENMSKLFDLFQQLGWRLLLNENYSINRGDNQIAVIGVENWGSLGRFQKYGDLEKALSGVEKIPAKILLSHDPSHWETKTLNSPVNIGLTFAGHTHGAQFGFEFPGFKWSPSQYIYKYWAGLYSEVNNLTGKKQYLYVNRGIGTIGYPGRVGIWPEITFVELQPGI